MTQTATLSNPPEWRWLAGLSTMVFPILLLAGFVMHPNLLDLSPDKQLGPWIAEWRGNALFHAGHILVMAAVPFIIASTIALYGRLGHGRYRTYGFRAAVVAVFGAFMLAVDKGALTLSLTAFDSLNDADFNAALPVFEAFLLRKGALWITWGYVVLPLGSAALLWALWRDGGLPRFQAVTGIVGLLLLMNPDIEVISSIGAALMCLCYCPLGWHMMRPAADPV